MMRNVLNKIIAMMIVGMVFVAFISIMFLYNEVRNARLVENGDNLTGQRIGVKSGWESDYFLSNRSDITLKRYDTLADMFMALNYKQVDAIAVDEASLAMAKYSIDGIKEVEGSLASTNYCAYVAKNNTEWLNKVNAFFDYFKHSDEYDDYVNHYFDMDWINNGELVKPTGTGDVIKVGYTKEYYPFTYVEADGEIRGNEIELMIRMANYYDMRIEFIPVTPESYAFDMKSGAIDVMVASISDMYRAESEGVTSPVTMSDGYIESEILCVVVDGKMEMKNAGLLASN